MPQQRGIGPGTASTWGIKSDDVEGDETPEADRTDRHHAAGGAGSALFPQPQVPKGDGENAESSIEIASSEVGKQGIAEYVAVAEMLSCIRSDHEDAPDMTY